MLNTLGQTTVYVAPICNVRGCFSARDLKFALIFSPGTTSVHCIIQPASVLVDFPTTWSLRAALVLASGLLELLQPSASQSVLTGCQAVHTQLSSYIHKDVIILIVHFAVRTLSCGNITLSATAYYDMTKFIAVTALSLLVSCEVPFTVVG
jgi:hypothetical protein